MSRPPASAATALLVLAYVAFISLGLPDALLGVAWPSLRDSLALSQAWLGAPLVVASVTYFASGALAGRLIQTVGIGRLLAGSTALVALSVFAFAAAPLLAWVLLATALMGLGSGAIDAALNTYAASHFRPKHMSWLHAAYAAGATTGPALMTFILSRGGTWRGGYASVGAILAVLSLAFIGARNRWGGTGAPAPRLMDAPGGLGPLSPPTTASRALRSGKVWLQIGTFFCYNGVEVATGQWSYTLLMEERGLDETTAGSWVAAYWGGLFLGRLLLGFVVERVGQVRMLRFSTLGACAFALLFSFSSLRWGVVALPLLSFCLASIYPGLMAETPRRVGVETAPHAVGFQVSAATLGVALLPTLAGLAGGRWGLHVIAPVIAGAAGVLVLMHETLVALTPSFKPSA